MAIDMNRMAAAALEAALDDGQPRPRKRSSVRAIAAGAAIATVARIAMRRSRHVPHPRDLADALRDRLAIPDDRYEDEELDEPEDEDEDYDDEPDAEGPEDEEDAEESEDEEDDEGPEDEDDGGPEDEAGESVGEDDEGEAEAQAEPDEPEDEYSDESEDDADAEADDRAGGQGSAPDLLGMLSGRRQPPLVLGRVNRRLDPAARPPEAPEGEQETSTAGRT